MPTAHTPFAWLRSKGLAVLRVLPAVLCWAGAPVQAQSPQPVFAERPATSALLGDLRRGGYVLYIRHGATDNRRPDRAPQVDLNDCSTQRVLSNAGRKQAVFVGQAIARAKIPVGEVFHSPLCRARESAELAFPALRAKLQPEANLAYTANLTAEEKKPVLLATRRLVSAPVAAGSNRVLVAHAPNMADLMGYFVKPEGTVVVLRPLGNAQFDYVASIAPAQWHRLLP